MTEVTVVAQFAKPWATEKDEVLALKADQWSPYEGVFATVAAVDTPKLARMLPYK